MLEIEKVLNVYDSLKWNIDYFENCTHAYHSEQRKQLPESAKIGFISIIANYAEESGTEVGRCTGDVIVRLWFLTSNQFWWFWQQDTFKENQFIKFGEHWERQNL